MRLVQSGGLLAPGTVFAGDYTIERPLSEGGMGSLYVVRQTSTGAQRALKLMHRELVRDPRLRQRFEQEAKVGARIESDHVVQVLGAGVDEPTGLPWLVMELLAGEDLAASIERRGALPWPEARDVFAQFTHAVAAAHRVGVVHRDLKPENIFLARALREGMTHFVKVLDFGIAKVVAEAKTSMTQALGTPVWMAPEQTEVGRSITPATDVWALGLIAFRMLTGVSYWVAANDDAATPAMVLREAVIDPIVKASARAHVYGRAARLPPGFDSWFAGCVDRRVEGRFQDAGQAREAFARLMEQAGPGPASGSVPARALGYGRTGTPPDDSRLSLSSQPAPSAPPVPSSGVIGAAPAMTPPVIGAGPSLPVIPIIGLPPAARVTPPPPPARPKPKGGKGRLLLVAGVAVIVVAGGALGLRSYLRADAERRCGDEKGGDGDGRLEACRTGCEADSKSCLTLGDLLRKKGGEGPVAEAAKSYEKACDGKTWLGCQRLGAVLEHGSGKALARDPDKALTSFQKACQHGSVLGCAALGRRLEGGYGKALARDPAKAKGYYDDACTGEAPEVCGLAAFFIDNEAPRGSTAQRGDVDALAKKALPALRKACAAGALAECVELGALREAGLGEAKDVVEAAASYRKACEGGLPQGCANEAALQLAGPDATRLATSALEALRKACEGGLAEACGDAGMLLAGIPFTRRQHQGITLFAPSCSPPGSGGVTLGCTESSPAQPAVAGLPKDLKGAVAQLDRACEAGVGVACAALGAFRESGFAVPKDPAAALAFYDKGCAAGAPDNCSTLHAPAFRAGDVWRGSYTCAQGPTDMALWIVEAPASGGQAGQVTAIFDFDFHHQTLGHFVMTGPHDPRARSLTLAPGAWIEQPAGWGSVGLSGQVSIQGTMLDGRIDNPACGAFHLVRQVAGVVSTRCATGQRFAEGRGCAPELHAGPTLVGHWTGTGAESNGQSTWPIDVTLRSVDFGRCGEIHYPSLSCGGEWYCVRSSDGRSIHARELITSGQGRCDTTGFVDVTLGADGQSASYRWSSPVRAGTSTGSVSRVSP